MSDFLENLSPKDKVIFFGGGALVIFFLVKTLMGSGSASTASAVPNQSDAAIQTANGVATAEQAFEASVTDQLKAMSAEQAKAQAKTTQGISDMFTGFQQTQGAALAALGGTISAQNSAISASQATQGSSIAALGTTLSTQDSSIAALGTTLSTQGASIAALGTTLSTQGSSIAALGTTLSTQGSSIAALGTTLSTQDSKLTVIQSTQTAQAGALSDVQTLINQMGRTPVYTAPVSSSGGQSSTIPTDTRTPTSNPTAGMVSDRSTSQAPGYAVPVMTSTPHVTTQADLAGVVGVSTSQQGYGLVTVKTATGTASVLAGSVFDPTSPNYKPGSNN